MNTITTLALLAHEGNWDGPRWFFPFIPLIWIAAFGLIWFLVARRGRGRGTGESVLAERYARGEIDEAEYRQRRDFLRSRKK